jgi:hypothetical protein
LLLFSQNFTAELFAEVQLVRTRLVICSAYIKTGAIAALLANISSLAEVIVVLRWEKRDLETGATDAEVYDFCKARGYRLGVNTALHTKLYSFDRSSIYLGSANLTNRGLSLINSGNIEVGSKIEASEADFTKIDEFLAKEVVWLSDDLVDRMNAELNFGGIQDPQPSGGWSLLISGLLAKPINHLWLSDLLQNGPIQLLQIDNEDDSSVLRDYDLLGLRPGSLRREDLVVAFKSTRMFGWLMSLLSNGDEVRFGKVSSELHNAIVGDGRVYRSDVKESVVVLFDWFEFLDSDFVVRKFNVAQSVRYLKNQARQEL